MMSLHQALQKILKASLFSSGTLNNCQMDIFNGLVYSLTFLSCALHWLPRLLTPQAHSSRVSALSTVVQQLSAKSHIISESLIPTVSSSLNVFIHIVLNTKYCNVFKICQALCNVLTLLDHILRFSNFLDVFTGLSQG